MGRRLVVFCEQGLANRLRILASARVVARVTGRELRMLWPTSPQCNCPYERLFGAAADVETVAAEERARWSRDKPDDLLRRTEDEVRVRYYSWLIRPSDFPHHRALVPELVRQVQALAPVPALARRVDELTADFGAYTIGVHLRRGDFHMARPRFVDNTAAALALTALALRERPDAGIFLATDDGADASGRPQAPEGVVARFTRRWAGRVATARPRSLDRDAPEAIEDALVELMSLRRTQRVIGTIGSTFSDLAAYGRGVPIVYAPGGTPRIRAIERALERVGLRRVVMALARARLGAPADSFEMAWAALRHSPEGEVIVGRVKRGLRLIGLFDHSRG